MPLLASLKRERELQFIINKELNWNSTELLYRSLAYSLPPKPIVLQIDVLKSFVESGSSVDTTSLPMYSRYSGCKSAQYDENSGSVNKIEKIID
jgi:hypothetical protein